MIYVENEDELCGIKRNLPIAESVNHSFIPTHVITSEGLPAAFLCKMRLVKCSASLLLVWLAIHSHPSTAQFHFNGIIQHVQSVVFNTHFSQRVNSSETKIDGRNDTEIHVTQNSIEFLMNTTTSPVVTDLPQKATNNGRSENVLCKNRTTETSHNRVNVNNYNDDDDEDDDDGVVEHDEPPECLELYAKLQEEIDKKATLNDQEEELLEIGFPLDYSFNETREEWEDHLISAPGCPASGDKWGVVSHPQNRHAWVHYGNPPRCFLIGTRGPCPLEMKLAAQKNSAFGVCKCACYFLPDETKYNEASFLYDEIFDPYFDDSSPYCYDGMEHFTFYQDTCYSLLSRGPCKVGEVLLWDSALSQPVCTPRDCPERQISSLERKKDGFRFLVNNDCRKVGDVCTPDTKASLQEESIARSYPIAINFLGSYSIDVNSTFPSCNPIIPDTRTTTAHIQLQPRTCEELEQKYSTTLQTCIPVSRSKLGRKGIVG